MSDIMYHYCSTSAFLKIVESRTLWLSDFRTTNDKMEGRWADRLFSIPDGIPYKDKILPALSVERHSAFRSPTYVACLSLEGDLLSQWRGYANNGQGVAIGLRADLVPDRPPVDLGRLFEEFEFTAVDVLYDGQAQRAALEELIAKYVERCQGKSEKECEPMIQAMLFELDHLRASMKSSGFSEERERRIIFKPYRLQWNQGRMLKGTKKQMELRVRATSDRIVEYFEYSLPSDAIKEVVLGPKNESEDDAVSLLLRSNEFQSVKVSRSAVSYR